MNPLKIVPFLMGKELVSEIKIYPDSILKKSTA